MFREELCKWLVHDDQQELFEIIFACLLNLVFLVSIALLLWVLDRSMLTFQLAKGYALLWIITIAMVVLLNQLHRFFRIGMYSKFNAYVLSNLTVSCFVQAGWSAFVTLMLQSFVVDTSLWLRVVLYGVGLLSCVITFFVVSSFYQGEIYKLVSLPLALISFIVFSMSPSLAHMTYGWFLNP